MKHTAIVLLCLGLLLGGGGLLFSQEEKARRATVVVDNAGSPEELERRLSAALETLERS